MFQICRTRVWASWCTFEPRVIQVINSKLPSVDYTCDFFKKLKKGKDEINLSQTKLKTHSTGTSIHNS